MTSVRPASKHIDVFASNPLVIWIQSYLGECKASNDQLANGLLLNNILNLIDPNAFSTLHIRNNGVNDVSSRAQNLVEILNGIKRYYQEKLQQVVVMKMPDILLLAKESHSELSYSAMNDILLLILGCAIQCEKKEDFIEHIKGLDVDVQRGLVASIQEITENPDNVIPYRVNELGEISKDELQVLCENLYRHLQGAMEQRDDYIETIIDFVLLQESEEYAREERKKHNNERESPKFRPRNSITQASFHTNNLLQAKEEKICNLQTELDEQSVMMDDLKMELDRVKKRLEPVYLQNKHLLSEALSARNYRDEIDVLKSQLKDVDALQAEISSLKMMNDDFELYKKRCEEHQDVIEQLNNEKETLAEQAEVSSYQLQQLTFLERENKKLRTQLELLMKEQGEDKMRITELVEELAKLRAEKQESITACTVMNAELVGLRMQREDDGLKVPIAVEYNQSQDLVCIENQRHLQSADQMNEQNSSIICMKGQLEQLNAQLEAMRQSNKELEALSQKNEEMELRQKNEQEAMRQKNQELEAMHQKNEVLERDAALMNTYRDQVDVLKAQLEDATKLGAENSRLRHMVEEMEEGKTKNEQLLEQVQKLQEEKGALSLQLEDSVRKMPELRVLEEEKKELMSQVNVLLKAQAENQQKMNKLADEVTKLRNEKDESVSKCSMMRDELSGLKKQKEGNDLKVPLMIDFNHNEDVEQGKKQPVESRKVVADDRIKKLEDQNRNLDESIMYYKNLIGKLVKVGLVIICVIGVCIAMYELFLR